MLAGISKALDMLPGAPASSPGSEGGCEHLLEQPWGWGGGQHLPIQLIALP